MKNYDDALSQIQALGILVDKPLTFDARIQRWKVRDEGHEKRGWTRLYFYGAHIVGTFGVWRGDDDAHDIKIERAA
jgi:hypothetical protein